MNNRFFLLEIPPHKFGREDDIRMKDKKYTILDLHYCISIDEFAYYLLSDDGELTNVAVEIVDDIAEKID